MDNLDGWIETDDEIIIDGGIDCVYGGADLLEGKAVPFVTDGLTVTILTGTLLGCEMLVVGCIVGERKLGGLVVCDDGVGLTEKTLDVGPLDGIKTGRVVGY